MSKTQRFDQIKKYFQNKDQKQRESGSLPMRSTERGYWGTSNLDDVWEFFEEKNFDPATKFVDLGCGDGRVAAVASLFVDAQGIEYDQELVEQAKKAIEEMELEMQVTRDDIRNINFEEYDLLYMYADQPFDFIEKKLLRELKGTLYLYHDTYHPRFLKKGKITWINQIPIFQYNKE